MLLLEALRYIQITTWKTTMKTPIKLAHLIPFLDLIHWFSTEWATFPVATSRLTPVISRNLFVDRVNQWNSSPVVNCFTNDIVLPYLACTLQLITNIIVHVLSTVLLYVLMFTFSLHLLTELSFHIIRTVSLLLLKFKVSPYFYFV